MVNAPHEVAAGDEDGDTPATAAIVASRSLRRSGRRGDYEPQKASDAPVGQGSRRPGRYVVGPALDAFEDPAPHTNAEATLLQPTASGAEGEPGMRARPHRAVLAGPLSAAFDELEQGLRADAVAIRAARQAGRAPEWSRPTVIGILPTRYQSAVDTDFVTRLAHAAAGLHDDWALGQTAPGNLATFVLALWVLDRGARLASRGPEACLDTRRALAVELGLAEPSSRRGLDSDASEPWREGWTFDRLHVDPVHWFDPIIRAPSVDEGASESHFPDRGR